MISIIRYTLMSVLVLALCQPPGAWAHKRWLLPSDFTLSDSETVTVDFTASNNVFYVDKGMPLRDVEVLAPNGEPLELLRAVEGDRRSSFDLSVAQRGTHRVVVQSPPVYFLSYRLAEAREPVIQRGALTALRAAVPEDAQDVQFMASSSRIETFITLGNPTPPPVLDDADGLSLQFPSHPNRLYQDESATFTLSFRGEPVAGAIVTVIADGSRYRDGLEERVFQSDENGSVTIDWPAPGRYLLEAALERNAPDTSVSRLHHGYFLTLEVLAP
tara:strand:- start:9453 stop:10271 length:819 start_codon:yes stop_codon:yes gene_type:complete